VTAKSYALTSDSLPQYPWSKKYQMQVKPHRNGNSQLIQLPENLNHQKQMKLLLYGQLLQRRLPGRVHQEMFQWMMIL
jgi:hypothetical protein